MIEKFIKWLASYHISFAFREGYHTAKNESFESRKCSEVFEMEMLLGLKVIVLSNEWEDLLVGTAVRIEYITKASQPVLVIKNCFTGREVLTFSQVLQFDEETLVALLKLTPYERWNIRVPHCPVKWDKKKIEEITDPGTFYNKLKDINFI